MYIVFADIQFNYTASLSSCLIIFVVCAMKQIYNLEI